MLREEICTLLISLLFGERKENNDLDQNVLNLEKPQELFDGNSNRMFPYHAKGLKSTNDGEFLRPACPETFMHVQSMDVLRSCLYHCTVVLISWIRLLLNKFKPHEPFRWHCVSTKHLLLTWRKQRKPY
jgi:hypothetical protein